MTSAGTKRGPGAQEEITVGPVLLAETPAGPNQNSKCSVTQGQCPVPACEACQTQGEDECPAEPALELELQERLKPEVGTPEERTPRPLPLTGRPSHRTGHYVHPRTEAERPGGLTLQKEELGSSQSELSSVKQHKKAKKRKSQGAPALPPAVSTASTPSEILGLERKAQRLRPLYQYINYCNPELNQAGDMDRDAEPETEQAQVPKEAKAAEQLHALLPMAGETSSGFVLPCTQMLAPPTHILAPLAEEARVESGGLPSLGVSCWPKAEVDKSTQVDIDKMLSVCAAPLVPPLSPQYR
ncbi:PREDICTED: uncharacterized protein C16orf86 homolog [Elephantulus edwardii]|uniref:uncharacterized protein C16orf86 homolog n=1 Tax=Elephantulus edwardii TaxID=28737 RepID=UPI0003F0E8D9|nr:PREDICTED: uncharacterized protein C16orf86 homolog [Elephantulus edwardii]